MLICGDERNLQNDQKKERVEQKISVVFIKMLKKNCAIFFESEQNETEGINKLHKDKIRKGLERIGKGLNGLVKPFERVKGFFVNSDLLRKII